MKQQGRPLDLRGIAVVTAAGGVVMVLAVQLLAKPATPPVARAAERPRAQTPADKIYPGSVTRVQEPAPGVHLAGAPAAATPAAPRLALAGEPPLRELFRPLVSKPKEPAARGGKNAPPLPSALGGSTVGTPPAVPAATPTPSPAPEEARIEMLGVVELGGQPQALLKHGGTGERRYFAKGENAFGYTVDSIQESEVTLSQSGKTRKVAMSTEVPVEGPGASTASGSSSFGGGSGRDRFGFGGERGGDRERRRDRDGDGGGRGREERSDPSASATAQIFSLKTWTERLKKLDEIKGQLEPQRYEKLRTFIAEKAKEEKK